MRLIGDYMRLLVSHIIWPSVFISVRARLDRLLFT